MSKTKKNELGEFDFNELDRFALDKESVTTDSMRSYYGFKFAEAERDRDYAKLKLKVFQAELAIKIRSKPEAYGLDKATNDPVAEMVTIKSEKKAKKLIEAEYKVSMYKQAVEKLRDRGKAIGSLIQLGPEYIGSRRKSKQMQGRLNKKGK